MISRSCRTAVFFTTSSEPTPASGTSRARARAQLPRRGAAPHRPPRRDGDGSATVGTTLSHTAGALTLASTSIIELALGSGGTHTSIDFTGGSVSFDPTQTFTFINAQNGTYDNILVGVGADPGSETNWVVTNPGFTSMFTWDGANIDLTLTAVPEPSTWVAGFLTLGVLAYSQRRRLRGLVTLRA